LRESSTVDFIAFVIIIQDILNIFGINSKDQEFTLANEVAGGLTLGLKLLIFLAQEMVSRFTCNCQDHRVVVASDWI